MTDPKSSLSLQPLQVISQFMGRIPPIMASNNILQGLSALLGEITQLQPLWLFLMSDGSIDPNGLNGRTNNGNHEPSLLITLDDALALQLKNGESIELQQRDENSPLLAIYDQVKSDYVTVIPLKDETSIQAIICIGYNTATPINKQATELIQHLTPNILAVIAIAKNQVNTQKQLAEIQREANIFGQIDAELNDNIELNYVFTMIMDWGLRYTSADAAALLLYERDTKHLRIMASYGYAPDTYTSGEILMTDQNPLAFRVASNGKYEKLARTAPDFVSRYPDAQSQLAIPIRREESVIAILALESKKEDAFTDDHVDFLRKLTTRAGVAVDNARLFTETRREREKLSYILRNIADIVIVVGTDGKIMLINYSAILAFHLAVDKDYTNLDLADVINHSQLQSAYKDVVSSGENATTEMQLPNGKIYHANIVGHVGLGHIVVLQDITYFKETDRLKTELVATVSHDLKQPLAVMRGYLDLLEMVNQFDKRSKGYIENLNTAFSNMRQLIDDLLDIARIEAGISLDFEELNLADVLQRSFRNNQPQAERKSIDLQMTIPTTIPKIKGDPLRLEQIFNNLISNAVKYTRPEGKVTINVDVKAETLRVSIEDNGLGIGPEDQGKIFERFYRVRRPETDSIEGTGLGLAIVKSLIEAHNGRIDLNSELGIGSTFRVTLPTRN